MKIEKNRVRKQRKGGGEIVCVCVRATVQHTYTQTESQEGALTPA